MNEIKDEECNITTTRNTFNYTAFKRQLQVLVPLLVGCFSYGMVTGLSSSMLKQINEISPNMLDEKSESCLVSVLVFGRLVGLPVNIYICRTFGRKRAFLSAYFLLFFCWMYVSIAWNLQNLLLSCFLLGFAAGLQSINNSVYSAEISDPHNRGMLINIAKNTDNLGILMFHGLSVHFHWRNISILASAISITSICLIVFMPESPYWLVLNNQPEKARKIFSWLRNESLESDKEFNLLLQRNEKYRLEIKNNWKDIFSKQYLKQYMIVVIGISAVAGSGTFPLIYYAQIIFEHLMVNKNNANTCIVIADTVRAISSISSCAFVKIANRRPLMLTTCAIVLSSFAALILCYCYKLSDILMTAILCLHTVGVSLGMYPLINVIQSEIFPTNVREVYYGICNITNYIITLSFLRITPFMLYYLGVVATFSVYAFVLGISSILLYFFLPETNNFSLPQIESKFEISKRKQI